LVKLEKEHDQAGIANRRSANGDKSAIGFSDTIFQGVMMAFQNSDYTGDKTHTINCTGDAVVGDEVAFERATFSGSFRNAKFTGFELVSGKIIRDSYGAAKQQHTFTLELANGTTLLIKGRNLYANGTWRKTWEDEYLRKIAADEKHHRGDFARTVRATRKDEGRAYV
jgi:hypothetical protein